MNLVHLPNYWKVTMLPKSISFTSIVIATCLLYLSGVVNGEPSDWRMTVPKNTMQHTSYSHHHQRHHIPSKDSQAAPSARSESSRHPSHQHYPSPSPTFSSRMSDPRMGYFYTDTTSKTSSTSVIPRPRSLSLSASPTSTSSTSSRKIKRASKTKTTEVTSRKSHEDSGTSRTFLITPFLATMAPVFLAQMFGMSMIPAAGLILLPVFLLPLALTMAVFLV